MADTTTATTETTTTTTAPPWHQGLDAEVIGHIQNRGLKLDGPIKDIVENLSKGFRETAAKLGVPANELIRIPKPDAPEADQRAFHQRLGAPDKPEGYEFGEIKYADGTTLEEPFAAALRATFSRLGVSKAAASEIAKDLAKFADADEAAATTTRQAAIQTENAKLEKEWGPRGSDRYKSNEFVAQQGARALGFSKETVDALESISSKSAVMLAMHKVGKLNLEDKFITGGPGTPTGVMTREQAVARKKELFADKGWVERYNKGDVKAKEELLALQRIETGVFDEQAA